MTEPAALGGEKKTLVLKSFRIKKGLTEEKRATTAKKGVTSLKKGKGKIVTGRKRGQRSIT